MVLQKRANVKRRTKESSDESNGSDDGPVVIRKQRKTAHNFMKQTVI